MHAGFVQAHIARGNRTLLVLGLVLAIVGVGLSLLFKNWFAILFIGVPGVIVLGVWLLRILNPSAHPIYKNLARYGDVQQVVQQVNQEFAGVQANDTPQFGAHWLAQGNTYGLDLLPWQEIAWLHIYTRIRNGVRSNYVRVWSRDGKQFVIPSAMPEQTLRQLYNRAPWAEVGYSPELEQEWAKQRPAFLERIDARKQTATR